MNKNITTTSHNKTWIFVRLTLSFIAFSLCFSGFASVDNKLGANLKADTTGLLQNGQWIHNLRKDHPRMFFNQDMLPALRTRVKNEWKGIFQELQKSVEVLPNDPPFQIKEHLFQKLPDGSFKAKQASQAGSSAFLYNGADQAVQTALLYLITEEDKYLELTKRYLKLANQVFQWTAEQGMWMDWTGNTRINALTAYDWIYNGLSQHERREIFLPILNYITQSQPDGGFTFRRTIGNYTNGNYGETALKWFAGLAGYGDGIDDKRTEKNAKRRCGTIC